MDALRAWVDSSKPTQSGYVPLPRSHDGQGASLPGTGNRGRVYRESTSSNRKDSHDRTSIGLFSNDILSLDRLGVKLHPDTHVLLEDEAALSQAFGGSGLQDVFSSRMVVVCAISACLGGLLFGFDQGLISIVLVMPQFLRVFPEVDPTVSVGAEFDKGLLTALLELGALLGALMAGFIADKYSRRISIAVGLAWFIVGSIIQTLSYHYGTLVIGRALGGVGIGLLSSTAPMYVAEISPPNIRGTLLVVEQFMIVFGIVVMYYITYFTRHFTGEWSYRGPFLLQVAPGLLLAALLFFLPYSPRWLAGQDRDRECLEVLVRLRNLPETDARVQAEWISIRTEAVHARRAFTERHPDLPEGQGLAMDVKREMAGWVEMFGPDVIKRTRIGIGIMFFQQFVGINALIYYSPTLFETLGLDYERRLSMSGIMNVVQLVAVMVALVCIERFGRKMWLLVGSVGMTLSHVIVAAMIARYSHDWAAYPVQAWVGVGSIFLFMFTYGISFGPMGWLLPAEVHSSSFRSKGVALATCTNWMSNFFVGLITPPLVQKTGYGTFLFFAAFACLAGIWTWRFVPETQGKSLEQMDDVFVSSKGEADELAKREIRKWLMRADDSDRDDSYGHEEDEGVRAY